MSQIPLDEMFDMYSSKETDARVNQFPTVPRGSYTQTCDTVLGEISEGEKSPYPGRSVLNCRARVANGTKSANIFFQMSHEVYVTDPADNRTAIRVTDSNRELVGSYKLDGPTKRFSQTKKALDMADASIGEIGQALLEYPIKLFVTEVYTDSNGGFNNIITDDDRAKMNVGGFTPRNFVQSVSKA